MEMGRFAHTAEDLRNYHLSYDRILKELNKSEHGFEIDIEWNLKSRINEEFFMASLLFFKEGEICIESVLASIYNSMQNII